MKREFPFSISRRGEILEFNVHRNRQGRGIVALGFTVPNTIEDWVVGWRFVRAWLHGRQVTLDHGFYGENLMCPADALWVGPLVEQHKRGKVSPLNAQRIREAEERDKENLKVVLERMASVMTEWKKGRTG